MSDQPTPNDELIAGFVEEATDLLQDLPERVDEYHRDPENSEAVNVVFRSVHTIKGNAGFFGLTALKQFSHKLEDVFDEIRQGRLEMREELYRVLVECLDMLGEMIADVADGRVETALTDVQSELLAKLESLAETAASNLPEARVLRELLSLADETAAATIPEAKAWSDRLQAIAKLISPEADASGEVAESADDNVGVNAEDIARDSFQCAGEDVTAQVQAVLQLFLSLNAGTYEPEIGQAFLDATEAFAAWAEGNQQSQLAETLRSARTDFNTVFASPIDVDAFLVSVVWDQLQPALCGLRVGKPGEAVPAEEPEAKKKPEGSSGEKKPADAASKSRILRIKEDRVDQFLDDVSSLSLASD